MISLEQAKIIVKENLPTGNIQRQIEYRGLYLFQVFTTEPGEEEMDPFYSVDMKTGEFRDFSIITDGDIVEITDLFTERYLE